MPGRWKITINELVKTARLLGLQVNRAISSSCGTGARSETSASEFSNFQKMIRSAGSTSRLRVSNSG